MGYARNQSAHRGGGLAMAQFPEIAMPDQTPGIIKCRGGWFAVQNETDNVGSGPWKTAEAARHALAGDFEAAHAADRKA